MPKFDYCRNCSMFEICADGNNCANERRPMMVVVICEDQAKIAKIVGKLSMWQVLSKQYTTDDCNEIIQDAQRKQGFDGCFRLGKNIKMPGDGEDRRINVLMSRIVSS